MKLTKLREFALKNQRRILAILAVGILLSFVGVCCYQRFAVPSVPEEEKLPPFALSSEVGDIKGDVSLAYLAAVDFPAEASSYEVVSLEPSFTEDEIIDLAARFDFTEEPQQIETSEGKVHIFTKEGETLSITAQPKRLSYVIDFEGGGEGTVYDQSTAIAEAEKFMASKDLPIEALTFFETTYLDWGGNVYIEAADSTDADFVEVSFVWTTGGTPILGEATTSTPVRIIFNRQGKVVSFGFEFLNNSFTLFSTVKLLAYDKAVASLEKGGLVIWARTPGDASGWAASNIDIYSFTPESVRLVYCQPVGIDFLYPVYLFEGKGVSMMGKEVEASVFLLAVSPDYIRD